MASKSAVPRQGVATAGAMQEQPVSPLVALPREVLLEVLQHLSLRDIMCVRRVCRRLHDMCGDQGLWRCLFRRTFHFYPPVDAEGTVPGPPRLNTENQAWAQPDRPTWFCEKYGAADSRAVFRSWWLALCGADARQRHYVVLEHMRTAQRQRLQLQGQSQPLRAEFPSRPDDQLFPLFSDAQDAQFYARAMSSFSHIFDTLVGSAPHHASLAPGASEEALSRFEEQVGVSLPPAARAIFRARDGRLDPEGEMFGALRAYATLATWRVEGLEASLHLTASARESLRHIGDQRDIVVLACNEANGDCMGVDCATADVVLMRYEGLPEVVTPADQERIASRNGDGCLRWLETYAAKLCAGYYALESRQLYPGHQTPYVSRFPRHAPGRQTATTGGVEVSVAVARIVSTDNDDDVFAYQISMRLLERGTGERHSPRAVPVVELSREGANGTTDLVLVVFRDDAHRGVVSGRSRRDGVSIAHTSLGHIRPRFYRKSECFPSVLAGLLPGSHHCDAGDPRALSG